MCRYACQDPSKCQIARFTVSPVKEEENNSSASFPPPAQFVRNRNVKFFSPASDSESEDEFPAAADWRRPSSQFGQQKNAALLIPSAFVESSLAFDSAIPSPHSPSASSSDSGFVETRSDSKEEESDGSNSSTETSIESIKSILMAPKGEREEGGEKKKVRFADDCGHSLVRCRSIQSRRMDALYADFVEIGPIEEDSGSSSGPWRVALLRKLWGITTTASSQSSTTTGEPIGSQRG